MRARRISLVDPFMVIESPETIANGSVESSECWTIWLCGLDCDVFDDWEGVCPVGGGFCARIEQPATSAITGAIDATSSILVVKPSLDGSTVSERIRSTRRLTVAGLAMATPADAGCRFFAKSSRISA